MDAFKRILSSYNIKVAQQTYFVLSHIFTKTKALVPKKQKSVVIYFIPCNDFNQEYIWQTKHQFGTCLKEHQK